MPFRSFATHLVAHFPHGSAFATAEQCFEYVAIRTLLTMEHMHRLPVLSAKNPEVGGGCPPPSGTLPPSLYPPVNLDDPDVTRNMDREEHITQRVTAYLRNDMEGDPRGDALFITASLVRTPPHDHMGRGLSAPARSASSPAWAKTSTGRSPG